MNTMKRLYKDRILYYASSSSTNVFRDLEKGECDLGLMIERRFNTMWSSGSINWTPRAASRLAKPSCP